MSQHRELSPPSSRSRGFTLVEVLVAVTLMTTALVPAFVLSGSAVKLSLRIKNELIAAALAQEGVEVVRAIRDANWFAGDDFAFGLGGCSSGCTFEYDSDGPEPAGVEETLTVNPDTGLYTYDSGGEPTPFSREVTIERPEPTSPELIVSSVVRWDERGEPRSVTVEYHLFDWLQ